MNFKHDLEELLAESGRTTLRLATEAGVSKDSLYRLLRGERGGFNSTTLEKLWPAIDFKRDIKRLLAELGWPSLRLAIEAGVSKDSLSRLLQGKQAGFNSTTTGKLWPHLYGDKRPAEVASIKEAA